MTEFSGKIKITAAVQFLLMFRLNFLSQISLSNPNIPLTYFKAITSISTQQTSHNQSA